MFYDIKVCFLTKHSVFKNKGEVEDISSLGSLLFFFIMHCWT